MELFAVSSPSLAAVAALPVLKSSLGYVTCGRRAFASQMLVMQHHGLLQRQTVLPRARKRAAGAFLFFLSLAWPLPPERPGLARPLCTILSEAVSNTSSLSQLCRKSETGRHQAHTAGCSVTFRGRRERHTCSGAPGVTHLSSALFPVACGHESPACLQISERKRLHEQLLSRLQGSAQRGSDAAAESRSAQGPLTQAGVATQAPSSPAAAPASTSVPSAVQERPQNGQPQPQLQPAAKVQQQQQRPQPQRQQQQPPPPPAQPQPPPQQAQLTSSESRMNIIFVGAECAPFSKTGERMQIWLFSSLSLALV